VNALPSLVVVSPDDHDDPAVLILREARCLFAQRPAWTEFYRLLLAPGGLVDSLFGPEERADFEQSSAFEEVLCMLADLRKARGPHRGFEPTRVITVRVPKSMHAALRDEAHRLRVSINSLCLSKLLQAIDASLVPSES
jgi:hypothetical protein